MSFDSFPTIEVTFMIPQGVSKLFLLMLQILYIVLLNYFNVQNFSKLKHKPRDLQIKVYNEVFFYYHSIQVHRRGVVLHTTFFFLEI